MDIGYPPGIDGSTLAGLPLPSVDSANAVPAAPLVGGRAYLTAPRRQFGQRMLAVFDAKANLTFTSSDNTTTAAAAVTDTTATDAPFGSTAVRVVAPTSTRVIMANAIVPGVTFNISGNTSGNVGLWFKPIANMAANNPIQSWGIELHSAGTPASPTTTFTCTHPSGMDIGGILTGRAGAGETGRWQRQGCPIGELWTVNSGTLSSNNLAGTYFSGATATGGADLSAIKFARFVCRATGATYTAEVAAIDYVPNPMPRAACIISFDDAFQIPYARAAMARHGFPGVVYPSPVANINGVGGSGKLTYQQLIALQDIFGWQIGSQAYLDENGARINVLSDSAWTSELSRLRNWQNGVGLYGGADGSYFSSTGADTMLVWPAMRKMFRTLRRFDGPEGAGPPLTISETYPFRDAHNIRACNGGAFTNNTTTDWTDRMKAGVDAAIAVKGVMWFCYHSDLETAGNARTNFDSLLAYLDANRTTIEVTTPQDLAARYG